MNTAEDLQRLERIAGEYASTKQDILAAAGQVAQAIVKLCGENGTVQIAFDRKTNGAPTGFPNSGSKVVACCVK